VSPFRTRCRTAQSQSVQFGILLDQRKEGFPFLTKWTGITWPGAPRKMSDPKAPLHPSVYDRFKLPSVVQYDVAAPYRPETLRTHEGLADYYKDIPKPRPRNRLVAYFKSYFLDS